MMLKNLERVVYFLERLERNYPGVFWICTLLLGFFITYEPEPVKISS